jgi:hypothetical protein
MFMAMSSWNQAAEGEVPATIAFFASEIVLIVL